MGKITFLDLVDRSGRIQLLAPKVDVDLGDVIGGQQAIRPSLDAASRRCR